MRPLTLLLAGIVALPVLYLGAPQASAAPEYTLFQETFEGGWPGPWVVGDRNLVAGLDY